MVAFRWSVRCRFRTLGGVVVRPRKVSSPVQPCPGPALFASASTQVPPLLRGGCGLRRIDATTGAPTARAARPALGGTPPWTGGVGRCCPTARDLPACLGLPSCRVALADPAGIHDAHGTRAGRRVAAFVVPAAARLAGCGIVEAHPMSSAFVATRRLPRRLAWGSASQPHPGHRASVVNRLARPLGLEPSW